MPDTDLSGRVSRVEREIAGLREQTAALKDDVRAMEPLVAASAELKADMRHMDNSLQDVRSEVHTLRDLIEKRDVAAGEERRQRDAVVSQERRATRTALWTLVGVLGASIITAIGAVVAAGV